MLHTHGKYPDNQKGIAMVEFSIVAFLLFLILFAIIDFGIMFYDRFILIDGVREVARAATRSPPATDGDVKAIKDQYCGLIISYGDSDCNIDRTVNANDIKVTSTFSYNFLVVDKLVPALPASKNLGVTFTIPK